MVCGRRREVKEVEEAKEVEEVKDSEKSGGACWVSFSLECGILTQRRREHRVEAAQRKRIR